MDNTERQISTALSGLLRHNDDGQIAIDKQGWADVDAVVSQIARHPRVAKLGVSFDRTDLERLVEADEKGRFEIEGGRVRAVSGHSFEVDIPLLRFRPAGPLYFGTVEKMAGDIQRDGLTHSSKIHTRLSATYDEALAIARDRAGTHPERDLGGPVVFEIDALAMMQDGESFGLNPAGEVITGKIDVRYVRQIDPAMAPATP